VGSEEASSAQPFQVWLHEFEGGKVGFNVITALIRVTLNVGLMKPWRGFTLVAGRDKLGRANMDFPLTIE
jgi:hypothetical protein